MKIPADFVEKVFNDLKASEVKTGKYTGLSETSVKKYTDKLKYFIKNGAFDDDLLGFINAIENINSRLGYFTAVAGLVKHSPTFKEFLGKDYEPVQEAYAKLTDMSRKKDTSQKTDKEEENWVDWETILEKTKPAPDDTGISQEQMLLYIYTLIPPKRLDYHRLFITTDPELVPDNEPNYIQILSKTKVNIILNEYKTSATNGTQITKVPAKFARVIWAYHKSIPQKKYLFTIKNSLDKPFASADTFGRYVRDTFGSRLGKNVSVDILRHSFITWLRKGDLSKAKKKKIAEEMGHSLDQQENYRKN
jgi:hypothetical protein